MQKIPMSQSLGMVLGGTWENPSVIPSKLFFYMGDLDSSVIHMVPWSIFWPTQVNITNSIMIGSAAYAGLTDQQTDRQSDRPTDHATSSVAIGCIWLLLKW